MFSIFFCRTGNCYRVMSVTEVIITSWHQKKCEVKDLSSQLIRPCQRWNAKKEGSFYFRVLMASCAFARPLFILRLHNPNTRIPPKKMQESTSTSNLIWPIWPTNSQPQLIWPNPPRPWSCVKPAEVAGISSRAGPLPPILGGWYPGLLGLGCILAIFRFIWTYL